MKKGLMVLSVLFTVTGAFAWWGPPPPPPCHYDGWGRGGCNFWPGFVGGLIGGAIMSRASSPAPTIVQQPVVQQPVIVQQPVVVQSQPVVVQQPVVQQVVRQPVTQVQNVWVEGRYVDQVQANGTVVRTWQPGHYEQRSVIVQ